MTHFPLRAFVLLFIAGTLVGLCAMIGLPQDKYLRYQALNDGIAPNAYWIYERIHFDPTPIDIAFIGTSRTGLSVHTRRLEEDLARHGITSKAANLHIVKNGVNMQYVVTKELLATRKIKLLVVEMIEREDRKPHPDFIFLADPIDVLTAPLLINLDYFSDLARLPGREVDLFFETQLEQHGLRRPDFVPPPYVGPNLDRAEVLLTLDGEARSRNIFRTQAEMEDLRVKADSALAPALLPQSLRGLEYRYPRYYMERILALARAHDTKVVFLYLPRYGSPAQPPPYAQYADQVALINPWSQLQDYRLWSDDQHVNWDGAKLITDYLAEALAGYKELQ